MRDKAEHLVAAGAIVVHEYASDGQVDHMVMQDREGNEFLEEIDGPTLKHALQGLHGELITLPGHQPARPDPLLLEERYQRFRAAG